MSLWALDTDIFSLLTTRHPAVISRVLSKPVGSVAIGIVSVQEVFIGRYNKIKQAGKPDELIAAYDHLEASVNLMRRVAILSYDRDAADHFERLRRMHRRIATKDLRIAAIALSHNATLVTANLADFGEISGLPIDDWTK